MTTLQQEEALRKYREELARWQTRTTEYENRKVNWHVFLEDITPAPDGSFLVKTTSSGGFTMTWTAPPSAKEQLLKLKKKDALQVAGTIKDYRFRESVSGRLFDLGQMKFEVELNDAVILPPGSTPIKLEGSSQPSGVYFFGAGGQFGQIVYAVDRSGSMLATFDAVRNEMLASIGQLSEGQSFHVIFFAEGAPQEPLGKSLVPATKDSREKVTEFLRSVFAKGQTDPIPAIRRAFDVLDKAPGPGQKVLFLLTDSQFPDNQKVIDLCKARNIRKDVHIYTFLYGERPKEAEETMKRIATDNGGKYTFASAEGR